MKKTLFMLLTLVLALALVFTAVSCEAGGSSVEQNEEEATATELIKDKKEATGDTLTEATLQDVASKNEKVIAEVKPIFNDIQSLLNDGSDISSAKITTVIKPQDGSSSFSFTTPEDYAKAKKYIKDDLPSVDESKLVPGKYSEVKIIMTTAGGTKSQTTKYKATGSTEYVTLSSAGADDQFSLDMRVISYFNQDANSTMDTLFLSIDQFLTVAKNAPKVTCTFEMTEKGGTKYTATVSASISASGRKIITVDEITLKKGTTELATLKCNASLKFSDDFSCTPANKDTKTEAKNTGSIEVNIDSIELNVDNSKLILSGKFAATLDFTANKLTLYAALSEKIGNDTIFDIEAGLDKASKMPDDLNKVIFYKCNILGKSYSSDSAMKVIFSMLSSES